MLMAVCPQIKRFNGIVRSFVRLDSKFGFVGEAQAATDRPAAENFSRRLLRLVPLSRQREMI